MTADKMREDFEAWMINKEKIIIGSSDPYPQGLERTYWRIWQAATEQSTAKIAQMQGRIDELVELLTDARDDVNLCLNIDLPNANWERYATRIKYRQEQLAKIDEACKKGVPVWGESLCELSDAKDYKDDK